MAKPKKSAKRRRPIEWGYVNGRQVVTHAAGQHAIESPAFRFYGPWKVIEQMDDCIVAFEKANSLDGESRGIMLAMTAVVASKLMREAANDIDAVLVLSPQLREAVIRFNAINKKNKAQEATGGAT